MAAAQIIVLSSPQSPLTIPATPPPKSQMTASMSCSPALPSPSDLFSKRRLSSSCASRACSVSTGADTGFTSASMLPRRSTVDDSRGPDQRLGLYSHGEQAQRSEVPDGSKHPPKRASAKTQSETKKRPKSAKKVSGSTVVASPQTAKVSAAKKPRPKQDQDKAQGKIKKVKITKPDLEGDGAKAPKRKTSKRFKEDIFVENREKQAALSEGDQYTKSATTRRKDWTPVKDTLLQSTALVDTSPFLSEDKSAVYSISRNQEFGNLVSNYGFVQLIPESNAINNFSRKVNGEGLAKRRKLEMVQTAVSLPVENPMKRSKSPRKKLQTITEKATKPFLAPAKDADLSLLQYFGKPPLLDAAPIRTGDSVDLLLSKDVVRKSSEKLQTSMKSKKANNQKGTKRVPVLLSPERALASANDQELLFGTSSQLARDESPTFIKDLREAIKVSELAQDQESFLNPSFILNSSSSTLTDVSGASAFASARNLWSVAARNSEGSLLDADIVDLSKTPRPLEKIPNIYKSQVSELNSLPLVEHGPTDSSTTDRDTTQSVLDVTQSLVPLGTESVPELIPSTHISTGERPLHEVSKKKVPPPKEKKLKSFKVADLAGSSDSRPDFDSYTTPQLTKTITLYGFKPIKARAQMIALLIKCWESKHRSALQALPTNVATVPSIIEGRGQESDRSATPQKSRGRPPKPDQSSIANSSTPLTSPPKKARGRPRKDTSSTVSSMPQRATLTQPLKDPTRNTISKKGQSSRDFQPIDEIFDPEFSTMVSPPRRRSRTAPQPLSISTSQTSNLLTTHPACGGETQEAFLSAKITQAITTYPPTHDPKRLTWNEKILMYDPIVLEDLATWLNTEGLGRVGVDEEVGPAVVRNWCEEKSVCCLWRENLRGGKRARR